VPEDHRGVPQAPVPLLRPGQPRHATTTSARSTRLGVAPPRPAAGRGASLATKQATARRRREDGSVPHTTLRALQAAPPNQKSGAF